MEFSIAEEPAYLCQIDVTELKRAEALLAAEVTLLEMVARGEPLRQVLDALSLQAETLCSGCICSILVVAPDRKHFELAAGPNLPDEYKAILDGKINDVGYGPSSLAVTEKVPIVSRDIGADPRWKGSVWPSLMDRFGYASWWSMPIMSASGGARSRAREVRVGHTPAGAPRTWRSRADIICIVQWSGVGTYTAMASISRRTTILRLAPRGSSGKIP